MARKTKPDQANVALTPEEAEVLDALAFLDGVSRAEALRPAVEQFLAEQAANQNVRKAIDARRTRQAAKRQTVLALADKRPTSERAPGA